MFGVAYAIALWAAVSTNSRSTSSNLGWNAIPIAGPLIFAHKQTCGQCVDDIGTPLYGIRYIPQLVARRPLRGYDAAHLAAALSITSVRSLG